MREYNNDEPFNCCVTGNPDMSQYDKMVENNKQFGSYTDLE
jgi:hypothetical protein